MYAVRLTLLLDDGSQITVDTEAAGSSEIDSKLMVLDDLYSAPYYLAGQSFVSVAKIRGGKIHARLRGEKNEG